MKCIVVPILRYNNVFYIDRKVQVKVEINNPKVSGCYYTQGSKHWVLGKKVSSSRVGLFLSEYYQK